MAASLHLIRYSPRHAVSILPRMRRHRRRLEAVPGLAVARAILLVDLRASTGGTPTPTRWAILCGWQTPAARREFLADPDSLAPFLDGAREHWAVELDAVRVVRGEWHGWRPATDGAAKPDRDEPLAVITSARVRARHLPAFTRSTRRVLRELDSNPAQLMRVGLSETPQRRATFSLWRSQGDMVRFAYGQAGVHDAIQRRSLDEDWHTDYFFARFRPVASSGTWRGRDPLADTRRVG